MTISPVMTASVPPPAGDQVIAPFDGDGSVSPMDVQVRPSSSLIQTPIEDPVAKTRPVSSSRVNESTRPAAWA